MPKNQRATPFHSSILTEKREQNFTEKSAKASCVRLALNKALKPQPKKKIYLKIEYFFKDNVWVFFNLDFGI